MQLVGDLVAADLSTPQGPRELASAARKLMGARRRPPRRRVVLVPVDPWGRGDAEFSTGVSVALRAVVSGMEDPTDR